MVSPKYSYALACCFLKSHFSNSMPSASSNFLNSSVIRLKWSCVQLEQSSRFVYGGIAYAITTLSVQWIETIAPLRVVHTKLGQKRKVKDFSFCPSLCVSCQSFRSSSDPGGIRTPNQQNRNLSFYPVELRSQSGCKISKFRFRIKTCSVLNGLVIQAFGQDSDCWGLKFVVHRP